MQRDEIIKGLNGLFAEELEAGIRYLHLATALTGEDRERVQAILFENMEETLEHARIVAVKLAQLGAVPKLDLRLSLAPEHTDCQEAIRTALAFESAALEAYRELHEQIGDDDPDLKEFLAGQVELESEHVSQLEQFLE